MIVFLFGTASFSLFVFFNHFLCYLILILNLENFIKKKNLILKGDSNSCIGFMKTAVLVIFTLPMPFFIDQSRFPFAVIQNVNLYKF